MRSPPPHLLPLPLLVPLALWTSLLAPPARAAVACEPWPGEVSPLPTVSDPDRVNARWAQLRSLELSQLAAPLELIATVDAHRLWSHVLCLDPENSDAKSGVYRTRPSRVHALAILPGAPVEDEPAPDLASALASIGRPLRLGSSFAASRSGRAAPPSVDAGGPAARAPDFGPADRQLAQAETLNRQARFEEALAAAEKARSALPVGWTPDVQRRRARIEAAAATAQVALGRESEARKSFGQALRADPSFRLDVGSTSPKVMRAFDAAKSAVDDPSAQEAQGGAR